MTAFVPEFQLPVDPAELVPKAMLGLEDDTAEGLMTDQFRGIEDYIRALARRIVYAVLPFDEPDITGQPPGTTAQWIDSGADTLNTKVMYPDGVTIKTTSQALA